MHNKDKKIVITLQIYKIKTIEMRILHKYSYPFQETLEILLRIIRFLHFEWS